MRWGLVWHAGIRHHALRSVGRALASVSNSSPALRRAGFVQGVRFRHASAADHKYCIDLVRRHDRAGYLATLLLGDEELRARAWAVRGFNVEVALIRDTAQERMARRMRYQFWLDAVDMICTGSPSRHPVALCLADAVAVQPLSVRLFKEVIRARAADPTGAVAFATLDEFEDYADQTVTAVLLLLLEAGGLRTDLADRAACHVGRAVAIAAVLRAAPFLFSRGEVRIPTELLEKHVPDTRMLQEGQTSPDLENLAYELGSIGNSHLETARNLTGLSSGAKLLLLPAVSAQQFLSALQRSGFDLYCPRLQRADGLLPLRMLWHSFLRTF